MKKMAPRKKAGTAAVAPATTSTRRRRNDEAAFKEEQPEDKFVPGEVSESEEEIESVSERDDDSSVDESARGVDEISGQNEESEDDESDEDSEDSEGEKMGFSDIDEDDEDLARKARSDSDDDSSDEGFDRNAYLEALWNRSRPEIVPGDSSDEEAPNERNTIGNVPLWWYKDEDHIGYDLSGKKIMKSKRPDTLEEHIARTDDPEFWRTVYDEKNEETLRLSDKELRILRRLQHNKFEPSVNPYEDYVETKRKKEDRGLPLNVTNEPKRRFVPSKTEARMITRLIRAIRNGDIPKRPKKKDRNYDIWADEKPGSRVQRAPKINLPQHSESYRPPPEYLMSEREKKIWTESHPDDRKTDYIPQQFDSLRAVPTFAPLVEQRFSRCLDIFMCPRKTKKKKYRENKKVKLPELPKPRDLRPFPSILSIQYVGHTDKINSISVHVNGQYLASGSEDCTVRIWDISSSRCVSVFSFESPVKSVVWNPNANISVLAVGAGSNVTIIEAGLGQNQAQRAAFVAALEQSEKGQAGAVLPDVTWTKHSAAEIEEGRIITLSVKYPITKICWHFKGDYFATLAPLGNSSAVLIHQLSKRGSQCPFKKSKSDAVDILFHPNKPFLLVCESRSVSVYNLMKQSLVRKLRGGHKQAAAIAIHPGGDNIILGSHDRRLSWFDMDLGEFPYKTIRYSNFGIRCVAFHPRLPLFVGGGGDGHLFVFHGKVFSSLEDNALIVPVKRLRAHKYTEQRDGVTDCCFHPTQPWAFTAGGDQVIRLWTEI